MIQNNSVEITDGNADDNKIIQIVRLAGMLVLENGGETYRAEETVYRICVALGYENSEVIALPTGIFITLVRGSDTISSAVVRVKKRTINLTKLEIVNDVSRALTEKRITPDEALSQLKEQSRSIPYNRFLFSFFAGMATAFFTLLYGGGVFDCAVAFICGWVVQYISSLFKRTDLFRFMISIMGGIIIASIAVAATAIFGLGNVDKIIIGGMIPLLPGLAMNNAIRDTMTGDLVSSSARFTEVILIAFALASGVGIVFTAFITFGGTIK